MKFVKGMIIGTMISAGIAMIYADGKINKRKIMRSGRKIAKKMGIM